MSYWISAVWNGINWTCQRMLGSWEAIDISLKISLAQRASQTTFHAVELFCISTQTFRLRYFSAVSWGRREREDISNSFLSRVVLKVFASCILNWNANLIYSVLCAQFNHDASKEAMPWILCSGTCQFSTFAVSHKLHLSSSSARRISTKRKTSLWLIYERCLSHDDDTRWNLLRRNRQR